MNVGMQKYRNVKRMIVGMQGSYDNNYDENYDENYGKY